MEDAIKEGADSIETFRQTWLRINKKYKKWLPEKEVFVIDFELLKKE